MPNIKPISDLEDYDQVLQDVTTFEPVFLTKDGRGRYAIIDMRDYERMQATLRLFSELSKGEASARDEGWFTIDEIESELGILR